MQNLELQLFDDIMIPVEKENCHLLKKLQLQILHENKIRELQNNSKSLIFAFLRCNLFFPGASLFLSGVTPDLREPLAIL
jgi:hypothetical protein